MTRRLNGHKAPAWTVCHPVPPSTGNVIRSLGDLPTYPRCPKHCDVATPPEHGAGDQYVCVCCGTQFTWRPS